MNNAVNLVTGKGTGSGTGINISANDDAFAFGNIVSTCDFGIRMSTATIEYKDNMTSSCRTNYVSGTDRGNNF